MKPIFERVLRPVSASFACHGFEGAAFDCPYHIHPEIEILRIDAGRGRFLAGDCAGRFEPGDLFVLGPNLPHMFCNDGPTNGGGGARARSRYVQFREECFGGEFFSLPELAASAALLRRAGRGLRCAAQPAAHPAAASFDAVFAARGVLRLAELLRLLHELARARPQGAALASEGFAPITCTRSSERLERALTHINQAFAGGDRIDLAGTARAGAMSPAAFSRFFRRSLGRTFQDYVTDLRVAEACRLLLDTDLTVTEICFKAGFNNLANFNRHYLRRKGMSPRQYRGLRS